MHDNMREQGQFTLPRTNDVIAQYGNACTYLETTEKSFEFGRIFQANSWPRFYKYREKCGGLLRSLILSRFKKRSIVSHETKVFFLPEVFLNKIPASFIKYGQFSRSQHLHVQKCLFIHSSDGHVSVKINKLMSCKVKLSSLSFQRI